MIKEEEIRKASMLYSFAEYNIEREDEDFIEGAEWSIRQIMKDAVDGIVCSQRGDMAIVKSNIFFPTDLKKGDKVRIIVIKEG